MRARASKAKCNFEQVTRFCSFLHAFPMLSTFAGPPLQAPCRHATAHHSCTTAYASVCIPLTCNSVRRNKHFLAARSVKFGAARMPGRGASPKSRSGAQVFDRPPLSTFQQTFRRVGERAVERVGQWVGGGGVVRRGTRRPMLGWRLVGVSGRRHLSASPYRFSQAWCRGAVGWLR